MQSIVVGFNPEPILVFSVYFWRTVSTVTDGHADPNGKLELISWRTMAK